MTEFESRRPKVTITTEKVIKKGNIDIEQFQLDEKDIPHMDEIQQIMGNGQARVTVSADFGIKEFGTGVSAMATVSLTCNQDTATIERAAKIAGDIARDIAQEQRQRAEREFQPVIEDHERRKHGGFGG